MVLIREFEERLKWLVETGVPVGAVHLYVGQEAVAVGTCGALRETDWIASTHRGHGHCIAKGVEVCKPNGSTCAWSSVTRAVSTLGADWPNQFHVWVMEWDATKIDLYLDGALMNHFNVADAVPAGTSV